MEMNPIESLIASGSKVWIDSVDPQLMQRDRALGISGATSNPIIVSDLIVAGVLDRELESAAGGGASDHDIAWDLTDTLVRRAQRLFEPVYEQTQGNDGYVSFELDPLLEDPEANISDADRAAQYIELGKRWYDAHTNRFIKIPATPGGIRAMEPLVAAGVNLNVTLIFTNGQYVAARDAIWRGAQKRGNLDNFKSVYSIFVSRIDAYTQKHVAGLSAAAQGEVGCLIAKRMWADNQAFWKQHPTRLEQEIVFASMSPKSKTDAPWKYVAALAGDDIQTNPPATNEAAAKSGQTFTRQVDRLPADAIIKEIDSKVDIAELEKVLMEEGIAKFAEPQKKLLATVAEKRPVGAAR
jgi:transaldolase